MFFFLSFDRPGDTSKMAAAETIAPEARMAAVEAILSKTSTLETEIDRLVAGLHDHTVPSADFQTVQDMATLLQLVQSNLSDDQMAAIALVQR
jgi:hypothetical protein